MTDRLADDGESVVLIDHSVVRLSALPTAIMDATATWTEVGDVATMLERRFDLPPDGSGSLAATERTVRELQDLGLIECD